MIRIRLAAVCGLLAAAAASFAQQANVNDARAQGLGPYLLFCFTGGLLSLITPCVFPMIPVTVSYFSKREKAQALPQALAYSIGIISTFALIGVAAAVFFGATGIARFTTNPWVNLLLGLVFVALALNLFGLYEFKVPTALARKTDQQRTRGGLVGPFFMGMTFSMTSFTCTAPIAGSLLAAAAKGDVLYPALGMATFGLAFAAPFFLLALFPSSLAKVPRGGEWMNVVKPALAFVELAAAVKFFSNADLGFQLGIITRPVFLVLWSLCFVGLALYLLGIPKSANKIGYARRVLGGTSLAFAVILCMGMTGWPLGVVESFPPPDPYPSAKDLMAQNNESGDRPTKGQKGRLEAKTFDDALALAKETGRTVFVDFTGVTCVNCRLMEKNVFPHPGVKAEFDKMVLVQLYTDRPTPEDQANQALQQKLAKSVALPTYVLVKPDGTVVDKYEGLAPTPDEFVKFLQKG